MELVYLWVEKYKNIKNQGFNFSPRFKFHYDKDSKKLTKVRDESTNYKSIFPDNINVTAIVGENGSGKSTICGDIYAILKEYELNGKEFNIGNFIFIFEGINRKIVTNLDIKNIEEKNNIYNKFELIQDDLFISYAMGEFSTREYSYGAKSIYINIYLFSIF